MGAANHYFLNPSLVAASLERGYELQKPLIARNLGEMNPLAIYADTSGAADLKRAATPCGNREPPVPQDLSVGRQVLPMSVPARQEPRQAGGRWDVVLSALESWPRTLRLCLILLVTIAAPIAGAAIVELIRPMLLCECIAACRRPVLVGNVVRGPPSTCLRVTGQSAYRVSS